MTATFQTALRVSFTPTVYRPRRAVASSACGHGRGRMVRAGVIDGEGKLAEIGLTAQNQLLQVGLARTEFLVARRERRRYGMGGGGDDAVLLAHEEGEDVFAVKAAGIGERNMLFHYKTSFC